MHIILLSSDKRLQNIPNLLAYYEMNFLILPLKNQNHYFKDCLWGLPSGSALKNLPANAGDTGLIPDPGSPMCRGATKSLCHKSWASPLDAGSHNYWAHEQQLRKPTHPKPTFCNKNRHRSEKPMHHNEEQSLFAATRAKPHGNEDVARPKIINNK